MMSCLCIDFEKQTVLRTSRVMRVRTVRGWRSICCVERLLAVCCSGSRWRVYTRAPRVGGVAGQSEGSQQRLELELHLIFTAAKDIGEYLSPSDDQWHARASAGCLCGGHMTTCRPSRLRPHAQCPRSPRLDSTEAVTPCWRRLRMALASWVHWAPWSVLMRSDHAVSRIPLALRCMSMISCHTPGKQPRLR